MPRFILFLLIPVLTVFTCEAQNAGKMLAPSSPAEAKRATALAESGKCAEAVPVLKKQLALLSDKDLERRAGLAGVRCAMTMNQPEQAVGFLQVLGRDFPHDADVLYFSVHAFSDLSIEASQRLMHEAPGSYQAHQLDAEALEQQGKWDEAAAEYRSILKREPQLPGLHFRLARVLLSEPNPTPQALDEARHECEQELEIDPKNAGAEYVLGEMAREAHQWPDAVKHFSAASKLDPNFPDAFMGLGVSLISAEKYSEAVAPLEELVKLQPENPQGHYHLGTAYSKTGRKEDAAKEFALYRQTTDAMHDAKDKLGRELTGGAPTPH